MPIRIEDTSQDSIGLMELVDYLHDSAFDPRDQESMISVAPVLRKLGNNQTFLSEIICKELKDSKSIQVDNDYTPQVLMLHAPQVSGQSYFIRACFWPGHEDEILAASGHSTFFYGIPHDHNFNFLTIGYQGPGYISDYFEYDYASVCGIPGESVDLRFMERSQLNKGSMLLYRAFQDVHQQMAPESFSVSINIMEHSLRSVTMDQYEFEPWNRHDFADHQPLQRCGHFHDRGCDGRWGFAATASRYFQEPPDGPSAHGCTGSPDCELANPRSRPSVDHHGPVQAQPVHAIQSPPIG